MPDVIFQKIHSDDLLIPVFFTRENVMERKNVILNRVERFRSVLLVSKLMDFHTFWPIFHSFLPKVILL